MATRADIFQQAMQLPVAEQRQLVVDLAEHVAIETGPNDALKEQIERWIAADDADPSPASDWAALREQLLHGEL